MIFSSITLTLLTSSHTKERWIEPFTLRRQPMGLLNHQTMSVLKVMGEVTPK